MITLLDKEPLGGDGNTVSLEARRFQNNQGWGRCNLTFRGPQGELLLYFALTPDEIRKLIVTLRAALGYLKGGDAE